MRHRTNASSASDKECIASAAQVVDRRALTARYGWNAIALWSVAAALAVHATAILLIRWNTPLLGMHAWRQSQTAITSYWMLRGSPWLAYETPVLGPPWSI